MNQKKKPNQLFSEVFGELFEVLVKESKSNREKYDLLAPISAEITKQNPDPVQLIKLITKAIEQMHEQELASLLLSKMRQEIINNSDTAIFDVICENDMVLVENLIKAKVDMSYWGKLAIWRAIYIGDISMVKKLIATGINVSEIERVLMNPAADGNVEMIKLLIEAGAKANNFESIAVRVAAECGKLEVVKLLIENGADVTCRDYLPFIRATRNGHMEVIKVCLEAIQDKEKKRIAYKNCIDATENTKIIKKIRNMARKEGITV